MTMRLPLVLASAVLAAGLAGPAAAADWEQQLTRQMLADHGCEVDFFVMVEESWREGRKVIRTRVQCLDRRLFDASRIGDTGTFEVERCGGDDQRSC